MVRPALLSVVLITLAGCRSEGPRPGPATTPAPPSQSQERPVMSIPAFSSTRAFEALTRQTSFGPRNPNSPGHDACLQYLAETLRSRADRVTLQEFTRTGYRGELLRLTNVVASFAPAKADRILLCAHWDTRPRAERDTNPARRDLPMPGANDGASGVAVLLEISRLLKSAPPPNGVDIVLFDGEDYGKEGDRDLYLLGSRYFARNAPAAYAFGILLDMVGDAQLEIPKELSSVRFAPDIVKRIWDTAAELGYPQFVDAPGDDVMDDHWPLNEAGIRTVDLIDFNYPDASNRYWHTQQDTPEHCSGESLEAVGTVVTHVVYRRAP